MNPEEYDRLNEVETNHWFYRGKRDVVRFWLAKCAKLGPQSKLVDVGAGTGLFAAEMSSICKVTAVDDHEEAVALASRRKGPEFVKASFHALPFQDGEFDAATALDVLEHLSNDLASLVELKRVMKPGGTIVVTVPAFMALWSEWDVALHHWRRYRRHQVRKLAEDAGLEIVECRYVNSVLFPPILFYRKARAWLPFLFSKQSRAEDRIPKPWLNDFLGKTFVKPACWSWFRPPFGVSVLAVLRKPQP
ncbi:MAG TPA: class I SAM-dependent methyltransferase [Planctomycetia bacterium]|nr:class I SAM-dependent methyltransferase [Planctomycetia bacterium]